MATPHNSAEKGQIAATVLLPGDPLRAQYIAEHVFDTAERVTAVRNMLGFTGTWHGNPVTVMGSGMGGPSAGIYSYELFCTYGVQRIIRIGTAGGLQKELQPGDLVLAMTASTDSNFAYQYRLPGTYSPCADFGLLQRAAASARAHNYRFAAGGVFSSDLFSEYNALGAQESWKPWAKMGCLVQDMETYALYCTAAFLGKKALSVLTHTDSCVSGHGLAQEQRLTALEPMFTVALESAFGQ
ncbi:purine-nucleoside phosphorylase [Treponema brennaborense]|uniref:Uridine phosphorylase n=1 Tax=Treponema brennaborense (strain DSM 12168 / CIP 105900 / DD5/3) TaxID=906968 RepID=F4LJM6_TREBD|nr:purine-nucleoside phosphorylase [Treponema brennaborense]AEE17406.1 purine nucleoside phosphorylase [Treponema brennaborense DSM 12168]